MIVGNIKNIEQELKFYPKSIQKGLQFLMTQPVSVLDDGRYIIDGEKLYANIDSYDTEPVEDRLPEQHVRYIDIQYIARGREKIGSAGVDCVGKVAIDHLQSDDWIKYEDMKDEVFVTLSEGSFAIYFPWDVHRPNCHPGHEAVRVKKVVVKVAMDTL